MFFFGRQVDVQEEPSLRSNQEETDTRVLLYLNHAENIGFKSAVVRTPDTDIFMILLHYCHNLKITVYLDTGCGRKRRLINITELAKSLGKEFSNVLLRFYVFTGEDCTSAFKGKGKVQPLKKLKRNERFFNAFSRLCEKWTISEEIIQSLEDFTCKMYGDTRSSSVDSSRVNLLRKMVGEGNF